MKESDMNEEDLENEKPTNINELLEPLVETKTPKKRNNNINQSVHIPKSNYDQSTPKNEFAHNSIDVNLLNKNVNNPINRLRNEIKDLNKDNETRISNYSNIPQIETLKAQNFIFILIIAIFSSLQFGIYLYIFNLYMKAMNTPTNGVLATNLNFPNISNKGLFYSFFLVLSWKYQIYLIIYIIYASYIYFKFKNKFKKDENKNNYDNEDSTPLINRSGSLSSQDSFINSFGGNPAYKFREFKYKYLQKYGYTYESYYNIFTLTSNIFNRDEKDTNFIQYYLNVNEMIKGIAGVFFAYILFVGSYFYYFGIIYLIQEITSLLPYYIQYNKKLNANNNNINNNPNISRSLSKILKTGNNGEYYKYVFPLLITIGLYYLQKTIINNPLFLVLILIGCIGVQIYNQKQFVLNSHEESPFQILFRTYLNYGIISLILVFVFEIVYNGFHISNLFYWVTNLKIFLACLIGFGICGAICYNMLIIFMRISLSNNLIVKLIKYFSLIIIDLVGVFIFRQYIISSYLDYIFGISLCAVAMFLLDFHKIL